MELYTAYSDCDNDEVSRVVLGDDDLFGSKKATSTIAICLIFMLISLLATALAGLLYYGSMIIILIGRNNVSGGSKSKCFFFTLFPMYIHWNVYIPYTEHNKEAEAQ